MDIRYNEMFESVLTMWKFITEKKRTINKDFPDDVTKRLGDIENGLKAIKDETDKINTALGVKTKNSKEYLEENKKKLSKKDLKFFEQIDQMKREIQFVEVMVKKMADDKKVDEKPMRLGGDKKDKKGKTAANKKRKRSLKRAGANKKWMPM